MHLGIGKWVFNLKIAYTLLALSSFIPLRELVQPHILDVTVRTQTSES